MSSCIMVHFDLICSKCPRLFQGSQTWMPSGTRKVRLGCGKDSESEEDLT